MFGSLERTESATYHGQGSWSQMLQGEVLVLEFRSIDGLSASAVVVGEVTTLAHEVWNDTVECGSLVTETLFASAQSTEVLSSLRGNVRTEL